MTVILRDKKSIPLYLLSALLIQSTNLTAKSTLSSARANATTRLGNNSCCPQKPPEPQGALCKNCVPLPLPPASKVITCQANVVNCSIDSVNTARSTFILPVGTYTDQYYPWWYVEQKLCRCPCACTCEDNQSKQPWGYVGLDYRYTQSFHANRLAECLLGGTVLTFQGSKVPANNPNAFTADYFGLAPSFNGPLQVDPIIRNHAVDLATFWNLESIHDCFKNWYVRGFTSLVHSTWNLRACTTSIPEQDSLFSNFPDCYMSTEAATASYNLSQALSGEFLFGDMQTPWKAGRLVLDRPLSDTKLADITVDLGYTLVGWDNFSLSGFIRGVIPTGTRLDPFILFSPVIGNGHYGQIGGGIEGHWCLWRCPEDNQETISLYYRGHATSYSTEKQRRLFDVRPSRFKKLSVPPEGTGFPANTTFDSTYIQSGGFSHNLLLKEFAQNNTYVHRLYNASEFATRWVHSSFGVAGEALLDVLYTSRCWISGIGYSFTGRSAEKIKLCKDKCHDTARRFGIKGTAGVCAQASTQDGQPLEDTVVLNATESTARIFNNQAPVDNAVNLIEPSGIEFLAWNTVITDGKISSKVIAQDSRSNTPENCNPAPVILTDKDLSIQGIPAYKVHRVFVHTTYKAYEDVSSCEPFIGVFGSVEWSQAGRCNTCVPSFWSIGVQTGFAF